MTHQIRIDQIEPVKETQRKKTPPFHHQKKDPFRRTIRLVLFLLLVGSLTALSFYAVPLFSKYQYISAKMEMILGDTYHRVRSSPRSIGTGQELTAILGNLEKLSYSHSSALPLQPGEYLLRDNRLFLTTRGGDDQKSSRSIVIDFERDTVCLITNLKNGQVLPSLNLEPPVITRYIDSLWEVRTVVNLNQVPDDLILAVLAAEDRMFFDHPGFASSSILRAAWVNVQQRRIIQGGSTLTQQLVKMLVNRRERTVALKIEEIALALAIEQRYSKEELLKAYLNNVYLGQVGPFAIHGVAAGAKYILGKKLDQLNLQECALLAGLIRSPNSCSPVRNPQAATLRTNTVLRQMAANGHVKAAVLKYRKIEINNTNQNLLSLAWYFTAVEKKLKQQYKLPMPRGLQITIDLAIDLELQSRSQEILTRHLEKQEKEKGLPTGSLQGAVVAMDPRTGSIRALTGGRNFLQSQFNRATHAERPVGSLIKPFVYLAAMGGTGETPVLTQASIIKDMPLSVATDISPWRPHNYDHKYKGKITVREALAASRNIPAVKVGLQTGISKVTRLVQQLHINDNPTRRPSFFLGVSESTPLKMAAAYGTLANGGQIIPPTLIQNVTVNTVPVHQQPEPLAALDRNACYIITDMLKNVMKNGTGSSAKKFGLNVTAAGKTGTTSGLRDAWFAGYTPSLVIVVWIGRDDNRPTKMTGAGAALPVWVDIMNKVQSDRDEDFSIPEAIQFLTVDKHTGKRTFPWNKNAEKMAFLKGYGPQSSTVRQDSTAGKGEFIQILAKVTKKRKKKSSRW